MAAHAFHSCDHPTWRDVTWRDVPPGMSVHGCLTGDGAYAVYDTVIALVGKPGEK